MEAKFSKLAVTIFISAMVALLGGFLAWFFSKVLFISYVQYLIVFPGSVSGLYEGSGVNYNGVQIGKVDRITIDSKFDNRVAAQVSLDSRVQIKNDTYATLNLKGMTGQMFIELNGGSTQAPLLEKLHGVFVIPYKESTLEAITTAAPKIIEKLDKLMEKVGSVISDDNNARLKNIFKNLDVFSRSLPRVARQFNGLINTANKSIKVIPNILTKESKHIKPLSQSIRGLADGLQLVSNKISNQGLIALLSSSKSL